jgi:hypothetical protein
MTEREAEATAAAISAGAGTLVGQSN